MNQNNWIRCPLFTHFTVLVAASLLCFGLLEKGAAAKAPPANTIQIPDPPRVPAMIAGRPYSITPGGSPGTWTVKWGDQSMTWKAQPWMEDRQQKLGPAYIAQWATPGLPMPFDIPIEKRDHISATDLPDR